MIKNVNEKLVLFLEEGPIWEMVNSAAKERQNIRYGGYDRLIEFVKSRDVESLGKLTKDSSQALYLAEQLIGVDAFWTTVLACIIQSIEIDVEDGDLTSTDGKMLKQLIKVAIS